MSPAAPAEWPQAEHVKNLDTVLRTYGIDPTGNDLLDLGQTNLLFKIDSPGTEHEILELTSGRYDGLRFSGTTGKVLPAKPVTREAP